VTNPLAEQLQSLDHTSVRLVALNLGGTPNLFVSPSVSETVACAPRTGVSVTLAMGRMHSFAVPFVHDLRITTPLIPDQGGLIRAANAEEPLYRVKMSRSLVRDILT